MVPPRILGLAAPLFASIVACASAQSVAIPGAPASGDASGSTYQINEADVRRILSTLAADSMEGRYTGSPGALKAARFITREMTSIGLSPAGDSGYYQKVGYESKQDSRTQPDLKVLGSLEAVAALPAGARVIGYNLIGVMRGSDPVLRDQIVVIAAHYDHLGIGKAVNGDSIYNGADDDASGVTAVLEIARSLATNPPRRTVVFMTTNGEEQGILGTQWYVAHPKFPLAKMVAEMEVEMIGRPDSLAGGAGRAWLTGYDRSTMGDMLKAANVPIVADPYPQMHFFERSDNIVFAMMGIPAHTLSSYNLHSDYHAVTDDIDRIDFAHVTAVIRAGAAAARILADGPAPVWKEGGRPAARGR